MCSTQFALISNIILDVYVYLRFLGEICEYEWLVVCSTCSGCQNGSNHSLIGIRGCSYFHQHMLVWSGWRFNPPRYRHGEKSSQGCGPCIWWLFSMISPSVHPGSDNLRAASVWPCSGDRLQIAYRILRLVHENSWNHLTQAEARWQQVVTWLGGAGKCLSQGRMGHNS